MILTEESEVVFKEYSDLSYEDTGSRFVTLMVKNKVVGKIKVWRDSEMEGREYIILNYEIVYLDTIEKQKG